MKYSSQKVMVFNFTVHTQQRHIDEGECRKANRCMEKLAIQDALGRLFPSDEGRHRVRIDGGHIRFNAAGYRHVADTPRIATYNLIRFDHHRPVAPHSYKVRAIRTTRVIVHSSDRQASINKARRERVAAGIRDKTYSRMTLHKRVVGFR